MSKFSLTFIPFFFIYAVVNVVVKTIEKEKKYDDIAVGKFWWLVFVFIFFFTESKEKVGLMKQFFKNKVNIML